MALIMIFLTFAPREVVHRFTREIFCRVNDNACMGICFGTRYDHICKKCCGRKRSGSYLYSKRALETVSVGVIGILIEGMSVRVMSMM